MNKFIPSIRWIIFGIAFVIAFSKMGTLWDKLSGRQFNLYWLLLLSGGVFVSYVVQGMVSKTICSFCDRTISILPAIGMNVMGGFWGLVLPLGGIVYKALYFNSRLHIALWDYTSYFGLAFAASLLASALFFVVAVCSKGYLLIGGGIGFGLAIVSLVMFRYRCLLPILPKSIQNLHMFRPFHHHLYPSRLFTLMSLQGVGLLVYAYMYYTSFKTLGIDITLSHVILLVSVQSVLMVVKITPGNLFIQEMLVGWLGVFSSMDEWDGVLAAALIRCVVLVMLLVMGVVSMTFMPAPADLKKPEDQKAG